MFATAHLPLLLLMLLALGVSCATGHEHQPAHSTVVIEWLPTADGASPAVRLAAPADERPAPSPQLAAEAVAAEADGTGQPETETAPRAETRPRQAPDVDDLAAHAPGARVLHNLHPEVRERALRLFARARDAGIDFTFIHGFAPYSPRKRRGPGGMATWHNFGLAFDINLAHRKSMADAKAHFEQDRVAWSTIGQLAADLGLVWGGSWRSTYDPFHFEWHPCPDGASAFSPRPRAPKGSRPVGCSSIITEQDLAVFLKLAGKDAKNWQRVWTLYGAPPREARP